MRLFELGIGDLYGAAVVPGHMDAAPCVHVLKGSTPDSPTQRAGT